MEQMWRLSDKVRVRYILKMEPVAFAAESNVVCGEKRVKDDSRHFGLSN